MATLFDKRLVCQRTRESEESKQNQLQHVRVKIKIVCYLFSEKKEVGRVAFVMQMRISGLCSSDIFSTTLWLMHDNTLEV